MAAPRQHNQCLECCLCTFLPPYAILVHSGDCGPHFWINICLNIFTLGIGGIIHAFWFCFCRPDDECAGGGNQININLNNQNNINAGNTTAPAPAFAAPVQYAPAPVQYAGAPPPTQPVMYAAPPPQAQPVYAPAPPTYEGAKA